MLLKNETGRVSMKTVSLKFLIDALDNSSQSIHTLNDMFDMNKCSHSVDVDKLCAISIRYDANKDIVVDGAVPEPAAHVPPSTSRMLITLPFVRTHLRSNWLRDNVTRPPTPPPAPTTAYYQATSTAHHNMDALYVGLRPSLHDTH